MEKVQCKDCKYCHEETWYTPHSLERVYQCFARKDGPRVRGTDSCLDYEPKAEEPYCRTAKLDGYTAILYGKSSLSVCDPDGREVFHTGARNKSNYTVEELLLIIQNVMYLLGVEE